MAHYKIPPSKNTMQHISHFKYVCTYVRMYVSTYVCIEFLLGYKSEGRDLGLNGELPRNLPKSLKIITKHQSRHLAVGTSFRPGNFRNRIAHIIQCSFTPCSEPPHNIRP